MAFKTSKKLPDAAGNLPNVLNEREHRIFKARRLTSPPISRKALAKELGISPTRVFNIEFRAFEKMQMAREQMAMGQRV